VNIAKVRDLEPEPENPNIITIHCSPAVGDKFMLNDEDDEE